MYGGVLSLLSSDIGELFFQIFDILFEQFFNLPNFPVFFFQINIGMLTNLIFLLQNLLENFTNE